MERVPVNIDPPLYESKVDRLARQDSSIHVVTIRSRVMPSPESFLKTPPS